MLGDYLREIVARPFGLDGCCTFVADWCIRLGYPDPMAFIRDTYADEEEVSALLRNPGLLRLAGQGFRSIGLKTTTQPQTGDVAVIERLSDDGINRVCAIRSGDKWVSRLDRGLVASEAPFLRCWSTQ